MLSLTVLFVFSAAALSVTAHFARGWNCIRVTNPIDNTSKHDDSMIVTLFAYRIAECNEYISDPAVCQRSLLGGCCEILFASVFLTDTEHVSACSFLPWQEPKNECRTEWPLLPLHLPILFLFCLLLQALLVQVRGGHVSGRVCGVRRGLDDDEAVSRTEKRFKDTALSMGGSRDASQVFRCFRGRDPTRDALLRHCGLGSVTAASVP